MSNIANLDWLENPEVFRVNRIDAHSDHLYYEKREELFLGDNMPLRQYLNGVWKFSYAENQDKRIKIITQINKGLLQTRIIGRKNILGDYVLFLDSDDTLNINSLAILKDLIVITNTDLVLYKYKLIRSEKMKLKKLKGFNQY